MNRVAVELTSTSPILHNCCQVRYETLGWVPKDDREQAESRLFRLPGGTLYLPWDRPIIAIGRAARSQLGLAGPKWPRSIVAAQRCTSMEVDHVAFHGDWFPQAFRREHLPAVALPRFDRWTASFTLAYDPHYYGGVLRSLLEHSGRHIGLPQFAPFAGKGPWGRFEVKTWEPVKVEQLAEVAV